MRSIISYIAEGGDSIRETIKFWILKHERGSIRVDGYDAVHSMEIPAGVQEEFTKHIKAVKNSYFCIDASLDLVPTRIDCIDAFSDDIAIVWKYRIPVQGGYYMDKTLSDQNGTWSDRGITLPFYEILNAVIKDKRM